MLKVGVVGVGHLGAHHARLYDELGQVELAGIYDIDPVRCAQVAEQCHARPMATLDELLAVVDALSVVVPTRDHRAVAEAALARGIAVLVEKPLAPSADEAQALVDAAARVRAPLMVGHIERHNGAFRAVVPHITRPRFIESHRLAAFPGRGLDVDVIRDLMIHDLDLVLAVARAPLARVQAVGVSVLTGSADIANARLEFEDGMVANLTASRASREPVRKMRIFQDDAYVSCDFLKRSAEMYRRRSDARPPPASHDTQRVALEILAAIEHQRFGPVDDPEPLAAELLAFVTAIREGRVPEPGGEAGVAALRLAEEVTRSMAAAAERMGLSASRDGAAVPSTVGAAHPVDPTSRVPPAETPPVEG